MNSVLTPPVAPPIITDSFHAELCQAAGLSFAATHKPNPNLISLIHLLNAEEAFTRKQHFYSRFYSEIFDFVDTLGSKPAGCYRSAKPKDIFSEERSFEVSNGLRDFLFAPNLSLDSDVDSKLSEVRLYLWGLSWEANSVGIQLETNINHLGSILAKGLVKGNKTDKELICELLKITQNLPIKSKLWVWLTNVEAKASAPPFQNSESTTTFIGSLRKILAKNFSSLPVDGIAQLTGPSVWGVQTSSPEIIQDLLPKVQGKSQVEDTARVKNKSSYPVARILANSQASNRISAGKLTLDCASKHFWPPVIEHEFDKLISTLLNEAIANKDELTFLRVLALKTCQLSGAPFAACLSTPFSDTQFSNLGWSYRLEADQLILCRKRPKRPAGATLKDWLKEYCYPLGEFVKVRLLEDRSGHQNQWIKSFAQRHESKLPIEIMSNLLGTGVQEIFSDKKALCKWVLGSENESLFTEESIKRQAFTKLRTLTDEVCAELCLATPGESTSAITGYCCTLEGGLNVAGSELALTQAGAARLINEIDQSSLDRLNKSEDDSIDMFNRVSERIAVLSLIFLGGRPVGSLIESIKELNLKKKLVILGDKYVEGLEETRVVGIPDPLALEIQKYIEFLRQLKRRLTQDHPLGFVSRLILEASTEVPFVPHLHIYNGQVLVQEHSLGTVLNDLKPQLGDAKTIFRNHIAQQIYFEKSEIELSMAQLGHSDGVRLLYGPTSTRCRASDLADLSKILNNIFSTTKLSTQEFWRLANRYKWNSDSFSSSNEAPLTLKPSSFGRARRAKVREDELNRRLELLQTSMEEFETSLPKKTGSSDLEMTVSYELAREFLVGFSKDHDLPKAQEANRILETRGWAISLPCYQVNQTLTSTELLSDLSDRDRFRDFYRRNRDQSKGYARLWLDLTFCSFYLGLHDPELFSRAMSKVTSRVVKDLDGTYWLEISRNGETLKSITDTQLFRIPIPCEMAKSLKAALNYSAKYETEKVLSPSQHPLAHLFGTPAGLVNQDPTFLARQICRKSANISRFELPAFLAFSLEGQAPTTSSTVHTIASIEQMVLPRVADTKLEDDLGRERAMDFSAKRSDGITPSRGKVASKLRALLDNPKAKISEEAVLDAVAQDQAGLSVFDQEKLELLGNWIIYDLFESPDPLQPKSVLRYFASNDKFVGLLLEARADGALEINLQQVVNEFETWTEGKSDRLEQHAALRRFINYAAIYLDDDFQDLEVTYAPKLKRTNSTWLTLKQYEQVLKGITNRYGNATQAFEYIRLLSLLYRFGLRIDEAIGLQRADVFDLYGGIYGVVVRKNSLRDIKFGKPPRYIFVTDEMNLTNVEIKAWNQYFYDLKRSTLKVKNTTAVFSEENGIQARLKRDCKSLITELSDSPRISFHGLRKGFAQKYVVSHSEIDKRLAIKSKLDFALYPASSSAFVPLRKMMGHTLFATTLSNYVHVIDQIVRLKTKGYRSGGNSTEVDNILDYRSSLSPLFNVWSVDKSESIDEPRKSAGLDDLDLSQMKNFIKSGSTTLTKVQGNFLRGLLNSELDFHPSAMRLEIDDRNRLYASKPLNRKCSFEQSDQFVLALNTLKEQRQSLKFKKIGDVQTVKFQDLFAKNFEIIVRTREQLALLSQIGIGQNWVLEFSEFDGKNEEQQLKFWAKTLLPQIELRSASFPIANETSYARIRSKLRARLKWGHSKNAADTWVMFCLSSIFFVPSAL